MCCSVLYFTKVKEWIPAVKYRVILTKFEEKVTSLMSDVLLLIKTVYKIIGNTTYHCLHHSSQEGPGSPKVLPMESVMAIFCLFVSKAY